MSGTRNGVVWAILLALSAGGCMKSSAREEPPPGAVVIHGAGSTFAAPLYRRWIAAYRKASSTAWIEYDAVGSGDGEKRFLQGDVDFGASDALLSDERIAEVEGGVATIPIASGGIVLAYNPHELPEGLNLPRDVYPDIFLGKITHWNDPRIAKANPGVQLPKRSITLIVRDDSSGTTNAFTSHLSAVSEPWRSGPGAGKAVVWPGVVIKMPGNERVAGTIKQTWGGIGYVEYGTARIAGLPMAAIENKSGRFVSPSNQNIQEAVSGELEALHAASADPQAPTAYPLVTNTWLFVRKKPNDPKRAEELAKFVNWCLGEGQSSSEALGYVRLSPERAAAAVRVAATIGGEVVK